MEYDLSGLFPGLDLTAFQPTEEERRRARRDGFLSAGFALLANPYRGQEMQALGNAGQAGLFARRQSLDDEMKRRQQGLMQAATTQKLEKDTQQQALINNAIADLMRRRQGGTPGAPAPGPQSMPGASSPPPTGPSATGAPAAPPGPVSAAPGLPDTSDLELLFAAGGKKDMADVLHRQGSLTQGPMGTLMRNGQVVGQVTNGGILYFDGTPGGRFEPTNPNAVKAGAEAKGAEKRAEAAATAEFDLVSVPDGRGGMVSMPRSEALARTRGAPSAQQPGAAPMDAGERVTINLKDAPRGEAIALLQQILGQGGAPAPATGAPAGGIGYDPGPVAQHRERAAIDTAAAGDKASIDLALKQIDKGYETGTAAASSISTIHEARRALDSGKVISGAGADFRLGFARALSLGGNGDAKEQVAATQTYAATMARQVLTIIKNLGAGSGISDADREYAAKIEGGQIQLDETSMRRLLDISEKASRAAIASHNQRAAQGADTFQLPRVREFYTIKEPGQYEAPKRDLKRNATELYQAQQAIKRGADPAAVRRRMLERGFDPEGL